MQLNNNLLLLLFKLNYAFKENNDKFITVKLK